MQVPEYPDEARPGDCYANPETFPGMLLFGCPGCGQFGGIRVGHPKPDRSPSWDITAGSTADVATLSLSPSILCKGCCGWHGYLTNGEFKPC